MIRNPYSGKFIVIEGLDGSGQSTQAETLKVFLSEEGKEVVLTKEPTADSDAGKKIKEILREKNIISSWELQKLFVQDRKEHLSNLIMPSLKKGTIVISDRYFFSTFAYGVSDGLNLDKLIEMNNDFLLPDLTFILKVSPEVCMERIEERGKGTELFEKREKLEKVWQTYEILPNKFKNVYMIDGEKTKGEVFSRIKEIVLFQTVNKIKKEV